MPVAFAQVREDPRIDLMAVISALDGLPAGPASIHSASPGVLKVARLLAAPPPASHAMPQPP